MKTLQERIYHLHGKLKSIEISRRSGFFSLLSFETVNRIRIGLSRMMGSFSELSLDTLNKTKIGLSRRIGSFSELSLDSLNKIKIGLKRSSGILEDRMNIFFHRIKTLGVTKKMDEYEKRKIGIFNLLNFYQLITGFIVPLCSLVYDPQLSAASCFEATLPAFISVGVLLLNLYHRYNAALISYFLLYPIITSIIYMGGLNLGVELFFILYGILSVFFLQHIGQMLFSISLSMISYFILSVLWKNYHYELETANIGFFLFNQISAIIFIFYGLYLIKRENTGYQFNILRKSRILHSKNLEIRKQKEEIVEKASLLSKQARELEELNTVKNKLFSVIAHDLKAPMYALRNVFQHIQHHKMPAKEIKGLIPEILNDFNYTTGLMENLLQWAKSQMQAGGTKPQEVDMSDMTEEILRLLRLQAAAKNIQIENNISSPVYIFADRDMIHLVLRNLVSNAIKFTPSDGIIRVGVKDAGAYAEIFIQDSGIGISSEALQKIRKNDYFTTKGTTNESGTGIGLMLCKEFILKNGGHLYIESDEGKGSIFSFTLPVAENSQESEQETNQEVA